MPYTRPYTKDGFLRKREYVYDEYYDCYICPQNEVLAYETTTREGYRMYRSNPDKCKDCPLLSRCTESKDLTKRISRHLWAGYVEEADHLRHTEENKRLYAMRKETIERRRKGKAWLRWTTLRGLEKVSMQAMLTFAAMNLKKLATWLWKSGGSKGWYLFFALISIQKHLISVYW